MLASVEAILFTVRNIFFIAGLLPQCIVAVWLTAGFMLFFFVPASLCLYAASSTEISFLFSHGFTMKSNAPRFIPSTASDMSAYAVKSTTSVVGLVFLISESQYNPSFPVLADDWKFISSKITSGINSLNCEFMTFGDATTFTSLKYLGSSNWSAALIPLLSSTTNILALFIFSFFILCAKI